MSNTKIRDFVFRGLLFDAEAAVFRRAGISVGTDRARSEEALALEALAPFGVSRRNEALEMARLYAVLHAFENEVRALVKETLDEAHKGDWWDTEAVPKKVRENADSRQKVALKDSWLEGAKTERLEYVDFGDLAAIIIANWNCFSALIPSQEWLKQRMQELEKCRNFVAHNRLLLAGEFQRVYMYISDWNKVVGL
jgi:hypothetical protein